MIELFSECLLIQDIQKPLDESLGAFLLNSGYQNNIIKRLTELIKLL